MNFSPQPLQQFHTHSHVAMHYIFVRGGRKKNPFWFNLNRQNSSGIPVGKQLAVVQAVSGRSPALARERWWASA